MPDGEIGGCRVQIGEPSIDPQSATVLDSVSPRTARKALTTRGSNCVGQQRSSSATASDESNRDAIGAVLGHRVVGVDGGDDAAGQRNRLAGDLARISAAAEPLVRRSARVGRLAQACASRQNLRADVDVLAHDRHLAWRQRTGLRQQRVGHRGFADVVKARRVDERRTELLLRRPSRARPTAHSARPARRARRVGRCVRPRARSARLVSLTPSGPRARPGSPRTAGRGRATRCDSTRVPLDLFQRLLPPLPPAIDRQREPISLKRLDQEVGDRALLGVGVEQLGVGGRDDHGGVRMVALDLVGEPEAVVSRHHHVDHREVVVVRAQRARAPRRRWRPSAAAARAR